MRSEFDTLEQYQESMKEFNENTRMGFEEFIQSHGSDRNKLQLRCNPYTSKKGGYGSFDLDFGLYVYQHQQTKVGELTLQVAEMKSRLNDAYTDGQSAMYTARQSKIDELTKQRDSFIKAYEIEMDESVELQKRVDASLIAFEKLKDEINELHGQCDLHLIKYLEEKSQVLEQALKGGFDHE